MNRKRSSGVWRSSPIKGLPAQATRACWLVALLACVAACEQSTRSDQLSEVGVAEQALQVAPTGPTGSTGGTGTATGSPKTAKRAVWVKLRERANLTQARGVATWNGRGTAVLDALRTTATRSQAGVRAFLAQRNVQAQPFWIANVIRIEADQATIDTLARRADVEAVVPDRVYSIPPIELGQPVAGVNSTEWGLDSIRVPQAWADFSIKGEGIVVANIDTGVQYDHPALATQYRGLASDGTYDHNYNWFDPSSVCGFPSLVPCDNAGHGTHTMGTMVGDDGDPGQNQVGVAPHARWIAAKGCEDFGCSTQALLASAQWILAPTDLNGQNPRADLRPNIVNNSWGAPYHDDFFQEAVSAWVAAGIFPAFSVGNSGSGCNSAGSPGDYPDAYSVGAYDAFGSIAWFSSRGPAFDGSLKPELAAPGVSVRSSVPGSGYEYFDGTSMAAPHLAGTVALMWAAAPALLGDVAATRLLLDQSAIDVDDTSCGGTAADNNVWGEGQLDAYAAIELSPRGPTGYLQGTITDVASAAPVAGATIVASSAGARDRSTTSAADGTFSLRVPVGTYDLAVSTFGYLTANATAIDVVQDQVTVQDLALALAPSHAVSGTVVDSDGAPIAAARVSVLSTPIAPVFTDASGAFVFAAVPEGVYDIGVGAGECYGAEQQSVTVDGDVQLSFVLPTRFDLYGYSCAPAAFSYVAASDLLAEYADWEAFTVPLPFPFTYYGKTYADVSVATDGYVTFLATPYSYGWNDPIPSPWEPNAAVYANWDDLFLDGTGSIRTETLGQAPNRSFVIEWRDARSFDRYGAALSFEIVLHENGAVTLQYAGADTTGESATIGIESDTGADGLQFSHQTASVGAGTAIQYVLPPSGIVRGTIIDANDGLPIAGAIVTATMAGAQARSTHSDATGAYQLQLPVGTYLVSAGRDRYDDSQLTLAVAEGGVYTANFALHSARATITPAVVAMVTTTNQLRTRTLTLGNTGSVDLLYDIAETGGRRQQTMATARLVRNANADPKAHTTQGLYTVQGPTPGGWTPDAPSDVLASFAPVGVSVPWGLGYTGDLWLSDPMELENTEFGVDGTPTGRLYSSAWGEWAADMAYDGSRNLVCQVAVGGDNGIHCFDPDTGNEIETIAGNFPWSLNSQRGLAYRASDDTFYIGGWNEGIVYHIAGLSHPTPGELIDQCVPADGSISGLAWNDSMGVLWAATNSDMDTIYELDPSDCTVLSTLSHPSPGYNGAGLEMDDFGNLWMVSQNTRQVYLIDSGVPAFTDVPWLNVSPASGSLAPGATQQLVVSVDSTGLTPGIYLASIYIRSNSGRDAALRIPVSVVVSAYLQAANAGGRAFTDSVGDPWVADKAHQVGSWGYVQAGKVVTSTKAIAGTTDDGLYKDLRQDPYAYRYDNVPNGVYEIDLRFAELAKTKFGARLYDVIVENTLVLPAHDIAYEVGTFTADDHTAFVNVSDGRLDVRFVPRKGSQAPILNALRVAHRPDR
jgi:subtilisin family serine protease